MPRRSIAVVALASVIGLAALALGLRDAPFLRITDVRVSGLTGDQAPKVRRALEQAARGMTTLHVKEAALREAVAPYASVIDLQADPDFPRALRIDVAERLPVAVSGGVAVSGDGRPMRGVAARGLPVVRASGAPAGERPAAGNAARLVRVLGAAPADLLARSTRARMTPRGAVVELRDGPDLVFGDVRRPRAKWLAAVAVLADPRSADAAYLDLRVPERPAAGGPAPTATSTLGRG